MMNIEWNGVLIKFPSVLKNFPIWRLSSRVADYFKYLAENNN